MNNNNDENNPINGLDNLDDPDSMLVARLIRQSGEIEMLKLERDIYKSALDVSNKMIEMTIDGMMEPIILREIVDILPDDSYKSYLSDGAAIIDHYKMVLESVIIDRKSREE